MFECMQDGFHIKYNMLYRLELQSIQFDFDFIRMQIDQKIKITQILIKGNGSTYCLLTGRADDQLEFLSQQVNFQLKDLFFSGYFVLALDCLDQPWIWGTLDTKVLFKETKLFNQTFDRIKIAQISCGWEHALLKSAPFQKKDSTQGQKAINQFIKIYGIGSNKYGQILSSYAEKQKAYEEIQKVRKELSKIKYFYELVQVNLYILDEQSKEQDVKILGGFRQSYLIKDSILYGKGQSKNYELGFSQKNMDQLEFQAGWAKIVDLKIILNINTEKIKKFRAGRKFVILLAQDGKVFALGTNQHNVFNNLVKITQKLIQIEPLKENDDKIVDLECGWTHILYKSAKNRVYSFGRNNFGQLGRQKMQEDTKCQVQFAIQSQQHQVSVKLKSGTQFSFALIDQSLYGWGWNEHHNIQHSQQNVIRKPQLLKTKVQNIWTGPAITAIKLKQNKKNEANIFID